MIEYILWWLLAVIWFGCGIWGFEIIAEEKGRDITPLGLILIFPPLVASLVCLGVVIIIFKNLGDHIRCLNSK